MRTRLTTFAALAGAAFALPAWSANPPTIEAVSVAELSLSKGVSARGDSMGSMLSGNGTFVVFTSSAGDLVPGDHQKGVLDLYLRNRSNGLVTLISLNASGTGGGNGHSAYATFTPDGRYMAFESLASNLVTNDMNEVSDVFVRDVVSGMTRLVSVNAAGTGSGDGASSNPVITPDGRYVAFVSAATDLVADDTNGIPDVFVRDLQTGVTTLVSVGAQAAYVGSSQSDSPVISTNGQFVAFTSTATNLVTGATNWLGEVYVRDLVAGTTSWASSNAVAVFNAATGSVSNRSTSSSGPVLTEDGRCLAFKTYTRYNPSGTTDWSRVFFISRWDRETRAVDLVATNVHGSMEGFPDPPGPAMTPDGRFIAYSGPVSTNSTSDVFIWDAQNGATTLASVAMDGVSAADGFADTPTLTPDGRYVTFVSNATNLVPNTISREFRVYRRDLQSGVTTLVTMDEDGAAAGEGDAAIPTVSDDGRWVALDSRTEDLVAGDKNDAFDVFVRDTVVGQTELVSLRDLGLTSVTGNGFSSVSPNCLSADGRYLVFVSQASDLVPNDTNGFQDVFVRDLQAGSQTLVSMATDGTQADSLSHSPVISADGRSVAFLSSATNLAGQVTNRQDNVYVRDLVAGMTTLASVSTNGVGGGNGASSLPSISADGSRVAFQTLANNLAVRNTQSYQNIVVRDLEAGRTHLVSSNWTSGSRPVISADGRFVVFFAQSPGYNLVASDLQDGTTTVVTTNLNYPVISANSRILAARFEAYLRSPPNQLLLHDLIQQTNIVIAFPGTAPETPAGSRAMSLSFDGRFVALANRGPIAGSDTNGVTDVFLYDGQTSTTTLVSRNRDGTGAGNGESDAPSISADGRFVVYRSFASDLVSEDTQGQSHIFLYDRLSGRNALISRSQDGTTGGNDFSSTPVISANGKRVVFRSTVDDFVTGDFNQTQDVFLYHVVAAPWVEVLGPSANGTITLQWDVNPGETYRIQHKGDLQETSWKDSPGQVTIVGSRASWTEPTTASPGQRFYRVVVVE
jgi:Tol biopolymer transport system component